MADRVFLSENRLQAWMDRDICPFRWFFSAPLLSCFSFDPSVLFSSTALFRITPISVNDILASFPISYWFLPSFKSLKTSLFLSWLVITEIFLIIYLIILNRILKLLLPLVTYFVALLSSSSNCYQCTVFEFWLSLIIPVMYGSDQMGIKIESAHHHGHEFLDNPKHSGQ